MLSFPNAKINLGLNIISKRADGYHNIESCFYPIPWNDALEILPTHELKFTSSGLDIPGSPDSNLCLKAYHLLRSKFDIPPVHIHLHKVIPMGAGLGGGSADGAFTLKMLNELFELGLNVVDLQPLAGQLGSDCPFFIKNTPQLATNTGTDLEEVGVDLDGYILLIKNPGIHIGTQEAYSNVSPKQAKDSIREVIQKPVQQWKSKLLNDFEESVFPNHPEIFELKKELHENGALYASMTGSGSTVYGIFKEQPDLAGFQTIVL